MLDFIRERSQGWIAWTIVILIIIPFALWGVNEYFGGGRTAPVAEVDGVPISQGQLQDAYYRERQQLQEMLGTNFDPSMIPEERLKQQVLEKLIRQELLVGAAASGGLRVSDAFLAQTIRSIEAFQGESGFDRNKYEQLLARQGMQPGYFETQVRRDLMTQQLYSGFVRTGLITEQQVDAFLQLNGQQRSIGYLVLPSARFADDVSVSDEAVSDYYEQYGDRFMVPERVKAAYLELDKDQLAAAVVTDDEMLRARYEARQENYRTPEQRRARHILIRLDPAVDDEAVQSAENTAQEVLAKLEAGESFAELAKRYSDDPGSAEQGGDLGFFGTGAMVPAFDEAVFSMTEGEVRGPVRSAFGFHLIKLEAVRESEIEPFEAVRARIRADVQREQAEEQFYDLAERLANLTYEHPDSLELAAEQLGLKVKETEPFPRAGAEKGIAANPKFTTTAFDEDVLAGGNNSETIEIGADRLVVLRVREHFPAAKRSLEEVSAEIRAALIQERTAALAAEAAAALVERIAGGEEPSAVAASVEQEWQTAEGLSRQSAEVDPAIARAAFRMAHPDGEVPTAESVRLPSGDQAVLALFGVQSGDTDVSDGEREQVRQMLQQSVGDAVFAGLISTLRDRADIE